MPGMGETDAYSLTTKDVATLLGVTKETVRAWTDKGQLSCWKTPNGYRRFRQSDIDAFIALGRT